MHHVVILAGGGGTRLWPLSHRAMPKQLLPLGPGGQTLLATAYHRVAKWSSTPLVVTSTAFAAATATALPNAEIIAEPVGKNTAPAVAAAAAIVRARDPEAILIILPADQHVSDDSGFAEAIDAAVRNVEQTNSICTIGIVPTRAETGFGYLALSQPNVIGQAQPLLGFVEKPTAATAEEYCSGGKHLWNAGIFVARAQRLLDEVAAFAPQIAAMATALATGELQTAAINQRLTLLYPELTSISIDHAVMEKASNVWTVPANVGWDDIGSWSAIPTVITADANGNSCAGTTIAIDSSNNVLISERGVIATVGVRDMVVVRRGDAVLVLPKQRSQDVRLVVDALASRGLSRYL